MTRHVWLKVALVGMVATAGLFTMAINRINPLVNFGEPTDPKPWFLAAGVAFAATLLSLRNYFLKE